jgi:hypothetical protein
MPHLASAAPCRPAARRRQVEHKDAEHEKAGNLARPGPEGERGGRSRATYRDLAGRRGAKAKFDGAAGSSREHSTVNIFKK